MGTVNTISVSGGSVSIQATPVFARGLQQPDPLPRPKAPLLGAAVSSSPTLPETAEALTDQASDEPLDLSMAPRVPQPSVPLGYPNRPRIITPETPAESYPHLFFTAGDIAFVLGPGRAPANTEMDPMYNRLIHGTF